MRENQRQVSDVTGVNLYGLVPAEQTGVSGGEKSDTKPERDHILVCQTSVFLSNPRTESLIIPPCCSPSLCLSLSLSLTHSPYPSLSSVFRLSVVLSLCFNSLSPLLSVQELLLAIPYIHIQVTAHLHTIYCLSGHFHIFWGTNTPPVLAICLSVA